MKCLKFKNKSKKFYENNPKTYNIEKNQTAGSKIRTPGLAGQCTQVF